MKLSYMAISVIKEIYFYRDSRDALEKLDLEPNEKGELDVSDEVKRHLEEHEDLVD